MRSFYAVGNQQRNRFASIPPGGHFWAARRIQVRRGNMYAYPITQFGVDHLERVQLPELQITSDKVLIKVHAVSLNYRDLMMVKGFYNPKMALPRIPCSDGAGEVTAVGGGG